MRKADPPSRAHQRTAQGHRPPPPPTHPGLALASWLVLLAGTLVTLHGLGSVLPAPPTSPGELGAWLEAHGAVVAAASVLRLVAAVVAVTLLVTTTLGALSHLAGNARAIRWSGVLLTTRQRRLVGTALGLGLTLTSTANVAWASPPPVMHAVTEPIEAPPPTSPSSTPPSTATAPTTVEVMQLIAPASVDVDREVEAASGPAPEPAPSPDSTWTIQPGDHLWGVSEAVLASAGQTPTDGEVARYLRQLIDRNQSVLVVPGNADLVYAGQVFSLPDLPTSM